MQEHLTPERLDEIRKRIESANEHNAIGVVNSQMAAELLAEIGRLKTAHAESALRADIYHEMLLSHPGFTGNDSLEVEVQDRMRRALALADALASLGELVPDLRPTHRQQ